MKFKNITITLLRIAALVIVLFVSMAAASFVTGSASAAQPADPNSMLPYVFLMCLLDAAVLSYPVMHSKWTGWKLIVSVFIIFFGIKTFLTQIETAVFLEYLSTIIPSGMVSSLFVQGIVSSAIFAPLCVLILGKMRSKEVITGRKLVMTTREWIIKLFAIAVIYVLIYILFGAFVFKPLAGDAFEQYYANLKIPEWVLLFQAARALVWTFIALLIIHIMKGGIWEWGKAVSSLFAVLMGSNLLIPNDIMPSAIRIAHFAEVVTSNFLFGWIVVYIINWKAKWAKPKL